MLYALKDRVEKEFERLVTEKILEPISHSEWTAPIKPATVVLFVEIISKQ